MHFSLSSLSALVLASLVCGCAAVDLNRTRADDYSRRNQEKIKKIAEHRAKVIADNETYFTDRLRCIGTTRALNDMALRVSVEPILDKTGKVYPPESTALSDMVINALSYVQALNIVETPLSGDIADSRVNLLSGQYVYLAKSLKDNIFVAANRISPLSFGILFPSQIHIAGALVRYDEGTETLTPKLRLDIDAFSFDREVETITVGLHLRLVNSGDGEVLRNSKKNKRGSVLLTNKFYKIRAGGSFFKLINTKQYGLDYAVTVADPKQYVIQEMVEKGVVELLSVLPTDPACGS